MPRSISSRKQQKTGPQSSQKCKEKSPNALISDFFKKVDLDEDKQPTTNEDDRSSTPDFTIIPAPDTSHEVYNPLKRRRTDSKMDGDNLVGQSAGLPSVFPSTPWAAPAPQRAGVAVTTAVTLHNSVVEEADATSSHQTTIDLTSDDKPFPAPATWTTTPCPDDLRQFTSTKSTNGSTTPQAAARGTEPEPLKAPSNRPFYEVDNHKERLGQESEPQDMIDIDSLAENREEVRFTTQHWPALQEEEKSQQDPDYSSSNLDSEDRAEILQRLTELQPQKVYPSRPQDQDSDIDEIGFNLSQRGRRAYRTGPEIKKEPEEEAWPVSDSSSEDMILGPESQKICPVCDKNLEEMASSLASAHANKCLDLLMPQSQPHPVPEKERKGSHYSDYSYSDMDDPEDVREACPICGKSLERMASDEASAHANSCLDLLTSGNNHLQSPHLPHNPQPKPRPLPAPKTTKRTAPNPTSKIPNPITSGTGNPSAFTKLMTASTTQATESTTGKALGKTRLWPAARSRAHPSDTRGCPWYKIMPGMSITVDAFAYGAIPGCSAYFLSHYHSDHYGGLTKNWSHGPIYCSVVTTRLVQNEIGVNEKFLHPLAFDERYPDIPGTGGVSVAMIEANHCPGSSLFLFEKKAAFGFGSTRILHTGDFRASPEHVQHPLLKPIVTDPVTGIKTKQTIDICYLDTTYLSAQHSFPAQEDVVSACAEFCTIMQQNPDNMRPWETNSSFTPRDGSMNSFVTVTPGTTAAQQQTARANKTNPFTLASGQAPNPLAPLPLPSKPLPIIGPDSWATFSALSPASASGSKKKTYPPNRLLVLCGTYSIGKEKLVIALAQALDTKIFAPAPKRRILGHTANPVLEALMTSDPLEAQVHVQPLLGGWGQQGGGTDIKALERYLEKYRREGGFSRAVAFRPTGWTYTPAKKRVEPRNKAGYFRMLYQPQGGRVGGESGPGGSGPNGSGPSGSVGSGSPSVDGAAATNTAPGQGNRAGEGGPKKPGRDTAKVGKSVRRGLGNGIMGPATAVAPPGTFIKPERETAPTSVPMTSLFHDNHIWRPPYTVADIKPAVRGNGKISDTVGSGTGKNCMILNVPYSEHSSFRELGLFIMGLEIDKVVPTVNVGSISARTKMGLWLNYWFTEREKGGYAEPWGKYQDESSGGDSGEDRDNGGGGGGGGGGEGGGKRLWDRKGGRGVRW